MLKTDQRAVRSFGNAFGTISGVVFLDQDRHGVVGQRDRSEVGIGNAHLYLDLDNDGTWEKDEPVVRTRSNGRYVFSNVPGGVVHIRVFPLDGMKFTAGDSRKVDLPAGGSITRYFGVVPSS